MSQTRGRRALSGRLSSGPALSPLATESPGAAPGATPETADAAQKREESAMGRKSKAVGVASAAVASAPTFAAVADALAEFDLCSTHCSIVPLGRGDTLAAPAPREGAHALGEIELNGQRYAVFGQRGPKRSAPSELPDDPIRLLTTREQQIVRLVCFGQVNKQIAHRLHISEYTVKTYLKQIFMKLGVRSRSAMVFRCAHWVGAHSEESPAPARAPARV